ncbi:hypothetical protein V491_01193, partial [Pseudogymnoascus sp. VKM F-3775]
MSGFAYLIPTARIFRSSRSELSTNSTHDTSAKRPTHTLFALQKSPESQSWVSLATPGTSAPLQEPSVPITGRSALSKPAASQPTPVLDPSASISSAPVVVTASSAPSASTPATSRGDLRVLPA